MEMWFGRYKGVPIENVPSDYLRWVVKTIDDDNLVSEAENELGWRDLNGEHFYSKDMIG